MSASEALQIYRPSHRIDKPGHLRKIGKRRYQPSKLPKGSFSEEEKKPEKRVADIWAWNDTSSRDTVLDGMDYCEVFDKIVSNLASPDPTDGYDYRCVYNTTKDENFPARNLLVAVLFSSWCDLHGFGIPLRAKRTTVIREVAWMRCTDESYIYSFGFICDMLNFNRDAVFKAMLNGTEVKRKYSTVP